MGESGLKDRAYLRDLRQRSLQTITRLIPPGSNVALLDVPCQRNVGDSLIWVGEMQYLKALGARVRYTADGTTFNESDLRKAMPTGIVLIHGGGNVGDLWPGHQAQREQVTKMLPDYRIVQLAQSVYFESRARAEMADSILREHPDFALLVRDELSLRRASDLLPGVHAEFCIDMALGAELNRSKGRPRDSRRVLVLARRDHESASGLADVPEDWLSVPTVKADWIDDSTTGFRGLVAKGAVRPGRKTSALRLKYGIPPVPGVLRAHRRIVRWRNALNVSCGTKLLLNHDLVISDRLHAHVMACLLGIPHVVMDNNHEKVGGVYDGYTGQFSVAHRATSVGQAREVAEQLLARI